MCRTPGAAGLTGEGRDAAGRASAPAAYFRPPVGGLLHEFILDRADDAERPAFELADVDEAKSEAVPGRDREPAARERPEGTAPLSGYGVMAFELSLVEVLKGVPEISEHLVTGRRLLAPLARQPPGPPFYLMSRPDQRLLFRPLGTEAPGKVELVRAPVFHPVAGAAEAAGLVPALTDSLYLPQDRLGPHLDKGPAPFLRIWHSDTVCRSMTQVVRRPVRPGQAALARLSGRERAGQPGIRQRLWLSTGKHCGIRRSRRAGNPVQDPRSGAI